MRLTQAAFLCEGVSLLRWGNHQALFYGVAHRLTMPTQAGLAIDAVDMAADGSDAVEGRLDRQHGIVRFERRFMQKQGLVRQHDLWRESAVQRL